ncbi:hypothetical protein AB4142_02615 [Variovorax sp. 2RAF20]
MNEKSGELLHDQPLQSRLERAASLLHALATEQLGWSDEDLETAKVATQRAWAKKPVSVGLEDGAGSTYSDDPNEQDDANLVSAFFYVQVAQEALKDGLIELAWSRCCRAFQLIGRLEAVGEVELRVEQALQPATNGSMKSELLKIKTIELLAQHRPPNGWKTYAKACKDIANSLAKYELSIDKNARNHTIEDRLKRWSYDDGLFASACTALIAAPPEAKA